MNEGPSGDTILTRTTEPVSLAQEVPYNPITNNYEDIPTIEVENPKVEIIDDSQSEQETAVAKSSKTAGILSGLGAAVTSLFAGI